MNMNRVNKMGTAFAAIGLAGVMMATSAFAAGEYNQATAVTVEDIDFSIERTGENTAELTVKSYAASSSWKFGDWVENDVPVKAYFEGEERPVYAYISTSEMYWDTHDAGFVEGKTYAFDLTFDEASDREWESVQFKISNMLDVADVVLDFTADGSAQNYLKHTKEQDFAEQVSGLVEKFTGFGF